MTLSRNRAVQMLEDLQAEGGDYLDPSKMIDYGDMSDEELRSELSQYGLLREAMREVEFAD